MNVWTLLLSIALGRLACVLLKAHNEFLIDLARHTELRLEELSHRKSELGIGFLT